MMTTRKFQIITVAIILGWLLAFVLIPNLLVLITSFLTRDHDNFISYSFSLTGYKNILDPIYLKVLWNSLYVSTIATIICLLIGYPFAYIVVKAKKKYRALLLFLIIIPFWTNSLIRIYGMKLFLGVRGLLNTTLLGLGIIDTPIRIMNTEYAVILGLIYLLLPFMILPIYSSLEKLDVRLVEAAKDLGANAFYRFTKIVIPLTMPGIIAGCLLVLIPAMGIFYVADILGGGKFLLVGNIIKNAFLVTRDWPFGSAISIVLTILMALLLVFYYRAAKLLNKKPGIES